MRLMLLGRLEDSRGAESALSVCCPSAKEISRREERGAAPPPPLKLLLLLLLLLLPKASLLLLLYTSLPEEPALR
jgi:hypothetical protein